MQNNINGGIFGTGGGQASFMFGQAQSNVPITNDENQNKRKTKTLSNMYINYGPINEIKALSAERGMRNIFAQDKQRILSTFAERFAQKYTEINLANLNAT